ATNSSGGYTVSWSGVSAATGYTLQEQVNGGSWNTVQANGNASWNASGKSTGTYGRPQDTRWPRLGQPWPVPLVTPSRTASKAVPVAPLPQRQPPSPCSPWA